MGELGGPEPPPRPRSAWLRRGAVVAGAVSGQLSQAVISFGLQAIAARTLGSAGLGTYALVYSVVVVVSALSNGLVGDSVTVLDRSRPALRSALQRWALVSTAGASVLSAVPLVALGLLDPVAGALFVVASTTFAMEGLLRRLLMSELRFWAVVGVDAVGLLGSLLTLLGWHLLSPLTVEAMLLSLSVGQVVGGLVAVACTPHRDRWWARPPPAMREVWSYGSLRAAQQLIRPSLLTLVRVVLVIEVGRAAFGQLEAARIYMAPATLVVQGLGSYLFATYARDRRADLSSLVRRADRTAIVVTTLTVMVGGIATLLADQLAGLVTGPSFSVEPVAVLGWSMFAAATAANSPYSSLAGVRGRQRAVIADVLTTALGTAVVAVVAILAGAPAASVPYVLALGILAQAVLLRNRVRRIASSPGPRPGH